MALLTRILGCDIASGTRPWGRSGQPASQRKTGRGWPRELRHHFFCAPTTN